MSSDQGLPVSLEQYLSTLDYLLEGCQIIGFDWRYLYLNESVAVQSRRTKQELMGRTMMEAFPGIEATELFAVLRRCMEDRTPHCLENQFAFDDGSSGWFDLRVQPVPEGIFILSIDITERKQAEAALRAREAKLHATDQRLAQIVQGMTEACFSLDLDWRFTFVNDRCETLFRFTREQMLGNRIWDLFKPLVGTPMERNYRRVMSERIPLSFEANSPIALRWLDIRLFPTREGIAAFLLDIQERKLADEALRESETLFSQAFHLSPDSMSIVRLSDRTVVRANEAMCRLWNRAPDQVIGHQTTEFSEWLRPQDRQAFIQILQEKGEYLDYEVPLLMKDGRLLSFSLSSRMITVGGEACVLSVLHDITEQKRAEALTAELVAIVQSSEDAIVGKDLQGIVTSWNAGAERIFGYTAREMIGQSIMRIIPHERDQEEIEILSRIKNGQNVEHFTTVRKHKDGSTIDISISVSPIKDSSGVVIGASKIARDISATRRTEMALRESEERFRQLAENIDEVFWMTDTDKQEMFYISPAYERIWERSRGSLYNSPQDWIAAIHPDDRDRVAASAAANQANGTYDETYRIMRPDGSVRWIRDRAFPIRDANGHVYRIVGTAQDITKQRQLEAQLRQAQKMEALGTLAGGVAHDFNNLLTIINTSSEIIQMEVSKDSPIHEMARDIQQAGERAASLSRQLLAFSRKQVLDLKVLNLNQIVANTERMLSRLIGADIAVMVSLAPDLGLVKADPGQIEQVLLNLAVNARDAMPQGGKLTIETANTVLDNVYSHIYPDLSPGRYVLLTVTDNGMGMDEVTQARIFDPFFTTKEPGRGTGLGLATVFGIIKQSGGHISVYSAVGLGTTFKIYIPRVDATAGEEPVHLPNKPLAHGTETILLSEDEPALRAIARRILEMHGYSVLEAGDGQEALRVAEAYQETIHLLITDVVMPNLNGRQLAERLSKARPNVKVLYLSGYTTDALVHHGILQSEAAFLQKPFTRDGLTQKVREVLNRY